VRCTESRRRRAQNDVVGADMAELLQELQYDLGASGTGIDDGEPAEELGSDAVCGLDFSRTEWRVLWISSARSTATNTAVRPARLGSGRWRASWGDGSARGRGARDRAGSARCLMVGRDRRGSARCARGARFAAA